MRRGNAGVNRIDTAASVNLNGSRVIRHRRNKPSLKTQDPPAVQEPVTHPANTNICAVVLFHQLSNV